MIKQRWFIALSPDGAARLVGNGIAKAFERQCGERCKTFDTFAYRQAFTRMLSQRDDDIIADLINQSLMVSCLDFQATHLLVTALAPVTLFSLNLLRKYRVVTVHWFFEDFRRAPYWTEVARGYDHFCAIQREPIEPFCATQGIRYHFLPTACTATTATGDGAAGNRACDIAFVGIPSAYRISALERLAANGFSLAIAGSGWKSYHGALDPYIVRREWTDGAEASRLLARAKIGINLSVDEPKEPAFTHISPRVYDILLAGCLLLSEEAPLLAESLPDCARHTFASIDQAVSLGRRLIDDYPAHTASIEKNRAMVLAEHSYERRAQQLMSMVE
jgi:spore maturation protein CgeB